MPIWGAAKWRAGRWTGRGGSPRHRSSYRRLGLLSASWQLMWHSLHPCLGVSLPAFSTATFRPILSAQVNISVLAWGLLCKLKCTESLGMLALRMSGKGSNASAIGLSKHYFLWCGPSRQLRHWRRGSPGPADSGILRRHRPVRHIRVITS